MHHEEALIFTHEEKMTHRVAAERIYARDGIRTVEEIDVFEMYDPSSWWGLAWIREFLLLEGDAHLKMVENNEICINGKFPESTRRAAWWQAIRLARRRWCAWRRRRCRRTAGQHQVPKEVRKALASGFGGTLWTVLMLLSKDKPELGN